MPRAKSATVATEPSANCLRFNFDAILLGESAAAKIREHYADCCEFEAAWSDLQDRRMVLLEQADDTVHGLLCSTAREIVAERTKLQAALDGLYAQRRQLCESLVPMAADAVAAGQAAHERVLAELAEVLKSRGVCVEAMPGFSSNPAAGHRQFRHRLETDDVCVASLGRLRRVQAAAGEVCAVAEAVGATTTLRWGGVPAQHRRLAEFLELHDDTVNYQLRLNAGAFH